MGRVRKFSGSQKDRNRKRQIAYRWQQAGVPYKIVDGTPVRCTKDDPERDKPLAPKPPKITEEILNKTPLEIVDFGHDHGWGDTLINTVLKEHFDRERAAKEPQTRGIYELLEDLPDDLKKEVKALGDKLSKYWGTKRPHDYGAIIRPEDIDISQP